MLTFFRCLFLFLCLFMGSAHAKVALTRVKVGDATILIKKYSNGRGKNFIHVHQNENTALRAARAVIESQGGSVITLEHGGGRNIIFHLNHQRYEFDPNRIFTDQGIKKTLRQYSTYSKKAHRVVKKLSLAIKKQLPPGKVIAVHNNHQYSLKNYLRGGSLVHDVSKVFYNPKYSRRNFYLVTKNKDFRRLKKLKFNSVLQAKGVRDDGSLSVFLKRKRYINVEAGFDQFHEQVRMLKHA